MAQPQNHQELPELIAHLGQFVQESRRQRIQTVLQQRTRYITVVLEDISKPHNASACLRSCDSFGVQDVHLIENRNSLDLNREVSVGSDRWLTLYRYDQPQANNTQICLEQLKAQGYQIVATTPHANEITIAQVPVQQKLALMFGTELYGLSEFAQSQADHLVQIPMFGFSESFNISVSVAICLYEVTKRLRASTINWRLSELEVQEVQLSWLRQSIRGGELAEQRFLAQPD
ncbi:MAG: RNA methyltransferase [Oscillatoriales cyanobacterium RM2_1_1]|nr:RNA methyltransferase [Oscillatoriales cyanobacterium SM2_3_0]NJO46406.1 RNA methyltransferase [Oscillatoriales cyanobacterium RM2_1_1]